MRKSIRWISLLLAIMLCVSLLGCGKTAASNETASTQPAQQADAGQSTQPAESAQPAQEESKFAVETLKLAGGRDGGYPNPFLQVRNGPGSQKVRLIFDSLLDSGEEGIIPWLAKEYQIDGNQYIFKLHENAKWHDGQPVTANDVAFTLKYYETHRPQYVHTMNGDTPIVESVEVPDDYTIIMNVTAPNGDTLKKLGEFYILPEHIWKDVEDPMSFTEPEAMIGCGMYRFSQYDAASGTYEFLGVEDYYGGKVAAEKLQFVPVSDPVLAFENGEIDITDLPIDSKDRYLSNPEISTISKNDEFGHKLYVNPERLPEFKDLEMRKALFYAIDRQKIVDNVYRGSGNVASAGHLPQNNYAYSDKVEKYDYDPEAAKQAFEGKNITVELMCTNSADDTRVAELIKMDLEKAGITVTVKANESATVGEDIYSGNYDMAVWGHGGWSDTPDYICTIYATIPGCRGKNAGGIGPYGWESEAVNELASKYMSETDPAKRIEYAKALQEQISKEIPLVPLATKVGYSMYRHDYYDGWKKPYDYQAFEQKRICYVDKQL